MSAIGKRSPFGLKVLRDSIAWKSDPIPLQWIQKVINVARTYFTSRIVSHWNRLRSMFSVFLIVQKDLSWRIFRHYNRSKLAQSEVSHTTSIEARSSFEVLIWFDCAEILDLPNLQSITLGDRAFYDSLSTIRESIEHDLEWNDFNRSSIITIYWTRMVCSLWKEKQFIVFLENAK